MRRFLELAVFFLGKALKKFELNVTDTLSLDDDGNNNNNNYICIFYMKMIQINSTLEPKCFG